MFGFGVGFGLGEFGSGGYSIEVDNSTVLIDAGAYFVSDAILTSAEGVITAQIMAASSLSIDPAGIAIIVRKPGRVRPALVTAKPTSTQTLRVVPQTITHIYHIPRNPRRDGR